MSEASIHPIVNDRIYHAIGHGQPIEGEKQMRCTTGRCYMRLMICIHVEHMIWEPANRKYGDNSNKHTHNLQTITHFVYKWIFNRNVNRANLYKNGPKNRAMTTIEDTVKALILHYLHLCILIFILLPFMSVYVFRFEFGMGNLKLWQVNFEELMNKIQFTNIIRRTNIPKTTTQNRCTQSHTRMKNKYI